MEGRECSWKGGEISAAEEGNLRYLAKEPSGQPDQMNFIIADIIVQSILQTAFSAHQAPLVNYTSAKINWISSVSINMGLGYSLPTTKLAVYQIWKGKTIYHFNSTCLYKAFSKPRMSAM